MWAQADWGLFPDRSRYEWYGRTTNFVFDSNSLPFEIGTTPSDPMNTALNELRDEVTNFGTMLGEYKATAKLFEDVGGKLLKAYRLAKRGNVTDAVKALGTIVPKAGKRDRPSLSGSWLQYHFGVETLLDDLHTSVMELRGEIERKTGFVRVMKKLKTHSQDVEWGFNANYPDRCRETESWVTRRVTIVALVDMSELKQASDHGLTSVPSLVWELTTMSWAFDYVLNVGEYLSALDVPTFLVKSKAWETVRRQQIGSFYGRNDWDLAKSKVIFGEPTGFVQRSSSRSVRDVAAVRPQWNPKLTNTRAANLLSVLRQFTRR